MHLCKISLNIDYLGQTKKDNFVFCIKSSLYNRTNGKLFFLFYIPNPILRNKIPFRRIYILLFSMFIPKGQFLL